MANEAGRLSQRIRTAILEGGAAVVGIADLAATLDAVLQPLFVVVFGMRYPDPEIARLPDDDALCRAIEGLSSATQRIYSAVECILFESNGHARCCRYDAVKSTFGASYCTLSQKAMAVLAGLGWIGKSSLLVTPAHGPRMRLGTLFTDVALVPDKPFLANNCGSCHVCREACPTGAVTEEAVSFRQLSGYRIDSDKCRAHVWRNEPLGGKREFCGLCLKECPFGKHPGQQAARACVPALRLRREHSGVQ